MPEITSRFVDCHIFRRRARSGLRRPEGENDASAPMDGEAAWTDEWLVLKRAPHVMVGGSWQMVSGTIEPGEKAYEAALRELKEETGLTPVHFYQASYVNRFYLAATDQIILSPVFCAEVADGQGVMLSGEHTEAEWVSAEEAARRFPWPGQKRSLQIVREQFVVGTPRKESCLDGLRSKP